MVSGLSEKEYFVARLTMNKEHHRGDKIGDRLLGLMLG